MANQKERILQKLSLNINPNSSLEHLLVQLQQKIRVLFPSQYEAFRFFDVNQNQRCSRDHFVFNCAYLHLDFNFSEVIELFQILDSKHDGTMDESEFANIF